MPGDPVWLVLCERGDRSAHWVYEGLVTRAPCPVELVVAEALAYAPVWDHRLAEGRVSTEIHLADGRILRSADVTAVFNRLGPPPVEHVAGSPQADRDYVAQELHALLLSWLESLECPVINRATPSGLSGPWLARSEWCRLAARAGLTAVPCASVSADAAGLERQVAHGAWPHARPETVLNVAGTVIGADPPAAIAGGVRRLAQLAATQVLGLEFSVDRDGCWHFVTASATPDLMAGGERVRERLATALTGS